MLVGKEEFPFLVEMGGLLLPDKIGDSSVGLYNGWGSDGGLIARHNGWDCLAFEKNGESLLVKINRASLVVGKVRVYLFVRMGEGWLDSRNGWARWGPLVVGMVGGSLGLRYFLLDSTSQYKTTKWMRGPMEVEMDGSFLQPPGPRSSKWLATPLLVEMHM